MDQLNAALHSARGPQDELPSGLILDLEETSFILVECLVAIIAEVAQRQRAGLTTRMRLPLSRDVRGFLREWGFARAFGKATGVGLMSLVERDNLQRIAAVDAAASDVAKRYGHDHLYNTRDGIQRVSAASSRYFGFDHWQPIEYPDDPFRFQRIVIDESKRWIENPAIKRVLRSLLGEYYQVLFGSIIHEALSNAFRHGGASSVLMVAKAEKSWFTLVFWDNGCASYLTLRKKLDSGEDICSSSYGEAPPLQYRVKNPDGNGGSARQIYSSNMVPTKSSADWELLLATLYPGITSDPAGSVGPLDRPLDTERGTPAPPGHGLANLVNAAVDVLGGSVAFRAGSYFMNVSGKGRRSSHKGGPELLANGNIAPYGVKFARSWSFLGNMVTVRLPIRT